MEEALQRNSFPPPSPRPEIITIFITGRVSLRCIKCSRPPSPADPDTLFGRTRSTAPRSTTSSVKSSSEWRFQEQRAEIGSLSKLSSNIVETDTIFVLYQRWYIGKGRSHVHPHVPSVATCIVIAYRVQFEHHKPLAGREKWIT